MTIKSDLACNNIDTSVGDIRAIRVGNRCINAFDEHAVRACMRHRLNAISLTLYPADSVSLYAKSDICERGDTATLVVNKTTNCDDISNHFQIGPSGDTSIWSLKIGNQCHDIQDVSLLNACRRFKDGL